MSPFNARVQGGFENRAGEFVHWVLPDSTNHAVQVKFERPLPEGKRVRLVGGKIEGVQ